MAFNKRGEQVVTAVLTEEKVRMLKDLRAKGNVPYAQLARLFGISSTHACRIVKGQAWAHVKGCGTDRSAAG